MGHLSGLSVDMVWGHLRKLEGATLVSFLNNKKKKQAQVNSSYAGVRDTIPF